jgi:hypothetical protein
MKRIACLLLGVALTGTGCLGVQNVPPPPPPPPVAPPPAPVLPGQVTDANAPQVFQALSDELDRAASEGPARPATPPPAPPPPAPPPPR